MTLNDWDRCMFPFAWRRISLAISLALSASGAHAISVGQIDVRSRLGEPLTATVALNFNDNETFSPSCVRVIPSTNPEDLVPGVPRAKLAVEPRPAGALLTISSTQTIEEPAVRLLLEIGCVSPLRREFVILLDPPLGQSAANPVAVPVDAPRRAESVIAQRQGRAAQAARDAEAVTQYGISPRSAAARGGAGDTTPSASRRVANSANNAMRRATPRLGDRLSVLEGDGFVTRIQAQTGLRVADMVDMTVRPELDEKSRRALAIERERFAAIVRGEDPAVAFAAREEEMQARIKQFGSDISTLRAELDMAAQRAQKLQSRTVPVWWWWITLAAGLMAALGALWMAARYRQARAESNRKGGGASWMPPTVRNEPRSSTASSETPEFDSMAGGLGADAPFNATDYKVRVVAPAQSQTPADKPPKVKRPVTKLSKPTVESAALPNTTDENADDGVNTLFEVQEHADNDDMVAMFRQADADSRSKSQAGPETISLTGGPSASSSADEGEPTPTSLSAMPLDIDLGAPDAPPAPDPKPFDFEASTYVLPSAQKPKEEDGGKTLPSGLPDITGPDEDLSDTSSQPDAADLVRQWTAASDVADASSDALPNIKSSSELEELETTSISSSPRPAAESLSSATSTPLSARSDPPALESFDFDAAQECQRVLRDVLQRIEESELALQENRGAQALSSLRTWLADRNDLPPMPWLFALKLARDVQDRAAYEALASSFMSQFGRRVPSWDEVLELGDDRGMQSRPELQEQVWQHWGTPRCIATVYNLLMDFNVSDDMFYNLSLQRDLLNLANICPLEAGA